MSDYSSLKVTPVKSAFEFIWGKVKECAEALLIVVGLVSLVGIPIIRRLGQQRAEMDLEPKPLKKALATAPKEDSRTAEEFNLQSTVQVITQSGDQEGAKLFWKILNLENQQEVMKELLKKHNQSSSGLIHQILLQQKTAPLSEERSRRGHRRYLLNLQEELNQKKGRRVLGNIEADVDLSLNFKDPSVMLPKGTEETMASFSDQEKQAIAGFIKNALDGVTKGRTVNFRAVNHLSNGAFELVYKELDRPFKKIEGEVLKSPQGKDVLLNVDHSFQFQKKGGKIQCRHQIRWSEY